MSITIYNPGASSGGSGIPASTVDAKGDLIVATANDAVTRLAVGSDNSVLTADSSQSTGVKWAAAASGGGLAGRFRSGGYYMLSWPTNQLAMTLSTEYAVPLIVDAAASLDRVAVSVNIAASAGGVVRFGLRSDSGSGLPGTLVTDLGTVAVTSTGVQALTVSQALTVGFYWVTATAQVAAPTVRAATGTSTQAGTDMARMGWSTSVSGVEDQAVHSYKQTGQSGALAGTFTLNAPDGSAPVIYARFA